MKWSELTKQHDIFLSIMLRALSFLLSPLFSKNHQHKGIMLTEAATKQSKERPSFFLDKGNGFNPKFRNDWITKYFPT